MFVSGMCEPPPLLLGDTHVMRLDALHLNYGSARPYGDPTLAALQKQKTIALSLDAEATPPGIASEKSSTYHDKHFRYQKWAVRPNFGGSSPRCAQITIKASLQTPENAMYRSGGLELP